MNYRRFGRTGWMVSEIGYGMRGMGGDWKGSDDEAALRSLYRAVELGCNFFDSAWAYGNGHSFILNNPAVSTIIPGMRKLRHVESNMAGSQAGPLPEDLHAELREHRWNRRPTEWSQQNATGIFREA